MLAQYELQILSELPVAVLTLLVGQHVYHEGRLACKKIAS